MVTTPTSNAMDTSLIPGQGTKIPHAVQPKKKNWGLPDGSAVKNSPASAGDMGSIPDLRGSQMLWSN